MDDQEQESSYQPNIYEDMAAKFIEKIEASFSNQLREADSIEKLKRVYSQARSRIRKVRVIAGGSPLSAKQIEDFEEKILRDFSVARKILELRDELSDID